MPGARNPKMARFSLNVTEEINERINRVADAAGANKGTVAAMALAAGLNLLERVYLLDVQPYVEQATQDAVRRLGGDVKEAGEVAQLRQSS